MKSSSPIAARARSHLRRLGVSATLRKALSTWRLIRPQRLFDIERIAAKHEIEPLGVLHVGANDGHEAEAYDRYGFRHVLWVEGFPLFFERLLSHIAPFPNQSALQILVSDTEGERVTFRVAANGVSSTTMTPGSKYFDDFPDVTFEREEELVAHRLDTVLKERGIELGSYNVLVLDVEGSELKALRSLGDFLYGFSWIACEVSVAHNFASGPRLIDIDRFLARAGFSRVETVLGSSSGDALYKRTRVGPVARLRMLTSSLFYSYGYYSLYRDQLVKRVKAWL
jgi:FkbM family methyltransferase